MALTFGGIIVLLIEASLKESSSEGNHNTGLYAFLTILVGALIPLTYSFRYYFLRRFSKTYKTIDLIVDSQMAEGIIQTIVMTIYLKDHSLTQAEWAYSIVAGLMYMLGKISIGMAVSYGYGGPANSIACLQTVIQIVLTTTLLGQPLTGL